MNALTSSCVFWLPFEETTVNEPPTITEGYPAIGTTVVIDQAQFLVVAIVRDPDDLHDLYFRWSITSAGIQENAILTDSGALAVASTLTLTNNEAYDGKTLTLVVEDPSGASARAEWMLQVGGEAR